MSSQSSDEPGGGRNQRKNNDGSGVPFQTADLREVRHDLLDQISYRADRDQHFVIDSRHTARPANWSALEMLLLSERCATVVDLTKDGAASFSTALSFWALTVS